MTQRPTTARAQGSMTTIMRAVQPSGERALRVGLVRGGRVVEERVFKQGKPVTAGREESCDIMLADASAPERATLFERAERGAGWVLSVPQGMTGRVAARGGVLELGSVRSVALDDSARGKLVQGDDVILFGFVVVPPAQPRPQLPVSARSGAESVDWAFTILASFSFLLHFGAVGMLYSDWMDPYVGDEVAVAGLVESVQQLPPARLPDREQVADAPTDASAATTASRGNRAGGRTTNNHGAGTGAGAQGRASSDDKELKGLTDELDRINISTLAVLGERGARTAEVMSEGGIPTDSLEDMARRSGRVSETDSHGLHIDGSSTTLGSRGRQGNGLADVGNTRSEGPTEIGETKREEGPTPVAAVSRPQVTGGEIPGAEGVVAGMQASFRRCYERGLLDNPEMSGSVRVAAQVAPNGEVTTVSASPSGSISSGVAQCIANRVRGAQFERPKNGAATLVIPVSLLQQKRR